MTADDFNEYDVVAWYAGLDCHPCVGVVTSVDDKGLEVLERVFRPYRDFYWISKSSRDLRRVHQTDVFQDWDSRHAAAFRAAADAVSNFRVSWLRGEKVDP